MVNRFSGEPMYTSDNGVLIASEENVEDGSTNRAFQCLETSAQPCNANRIYFLKYSLAAGRLLGDDVLLKDMLTLCSLLL